MSKEKILATIMTELWEIHDKRQFKELGEKTKELLKNLDFDENNSSKIAEHIKKSFEIHGEIDDKLENKKFNKNLRRIIREYEIEIGEELREAFKIAQFKNYGKLSKHHCKWWINCLLKNITGNKLYYCKILLHLFLEQLVKLNKPVPAIKATYQLYLAGRYGHDKRDRERTIFELEKFWLIILHNDPKPFMF